MALVWGLERRVYMRGFVLACLFFFRPWGLGFDFSVGFAHFGLSVGSLGFSVQRVSDAERVTHLDIAGTVPCFGVRIQGLRVSGS